MLTVSGLHAGYGAARILHGVSIRVNEGSVTALIGANGAGKTTLMRSLSGLILPTAGSVEFDGADLTRSDSSVRVGAGMALSPEGRMVFPTLTVEENLRLGAIHRRAWTRHKEQIEKTYAMFPRLLERRRLTAGSLSGGEQQMLAVARALMSQPRLLLLDEPTLGLAPVIAHEVFDILKQLSAQGLTLLIAEQNVQRTLEMADYAYVIEHGQVHSEGPGLQLLDDPAIKHAYLGM
nr:ABC transporter ATP-binding protein [Variovorax sp. SRS16]